MRRVRFGGRTWTIKTIPENDVDQLDEEKSGQIDTSRGRILIREGSPDEMMVTILHELWHFADPNASEKTVRERDWIWKDMLEAFGVDLTPLLGGHDERCGDP